MTARVGVILFPGSNCEQDVVHAVEYLGAEANYVWHRSTDLRTFDAVVLPGGFSYGDYLRTGAIAAFSPVMEAVRGFAKEGGPVIGICNGFQILCEAGILPGALRRNAGLKFICKTVNVRVETANSPFTQQAARHQVLEMPINHFEGNYFCPPGLLDRIEGEERVAFRYCSPTGEVTPGANPNGALRGVAGIVSEERNVLGLMPHPERAVDPAVGPTDGEVIWRSLLNAK